MFKLTHNGQPAGVYKTHVDVFNAIDSRLKQIDGVEEVCAFNHNDCDAKTNIQMWRHKDSDAQEMFTVTEVE